MLDLKKNNVDPTVLLELVIKRLTKSKGHHLKNQSLPKSSESEFLGK